MIIEADNVILFIHPKFTSKEPVLDELTLKMAYALENTTEENLVVGFLDKKTKLAHIHKGTQTMGVHQCVCGARSHGGDYGIAVGDKTIYTNFLSAHYMAFHRDEVSERDLKIVSCLPEPPDWWKAERKRLWAYIPTSNKN